MDNKTLSYLHAINILAMAKIDALRTLHEQCAGDWVRAWHSDLAKYLPRERDLNGKLVRVDYAKLKKAINPEKEFKRLQKEKIDLMVWGDPAYPKPLKHIAQPPFLLYIRGHKSVLKNKCFGVVGTRALTDYGRRATPEIVREVVRGGFTVVSGLAAGIDTLAHKATLENGGPTIAVLGTGLDDPTIFPPQNLKLAQQIIAAGGAIISEYAPGTHGTKFTFPQRNRIISGLARGVLVVEADIQSGALITARAAIDQNRDLFCLPGPIYAKTSQGTNYMIQQGAKLVVTGQDILDEYNISLAQVERKITPANPEEAKILALLSTEPVTADEIIRQSGLDAAQANATLVMLELSRKVKNLGNSKFVLYS